MWTDLPEDLWQSFYDVTTWGSRYDRETAIEEIQQYMTDNHTCTFGHGRSGVEACDDLSLPGTDRCERHYD